MVKKLACIFSFLFIIYPAFAQKTDRNKNNQKHYSNSISLNVDLPIGYFFKTHSIGIGINYLWSDRRLGRLNYFPDNPFGFIFNTGADLFFGKTDSYNVSYGGYLYIHLYGGGIFNPSAKVNISLTAGPMLRIYKGDSQLGIGADLRGSYAMSNRISIATVITITKEKDADPFYIGSLQVSFAF